MNTNYEAELSERVFTDVNEYVDQFPIYKVCLYDSNINIW